MNSQLSSKPVGHPARLRYVCNRAGRGILDASEADLQAGALFSEALAVNSVSRFAKLLRPENKYARLAVSYYGAFMLQVTELAEESWDEGLAASADHLESRYKSPLLTGFGVTANIIEAAMRGYQEYSASASEPASVSALRNGLLDPANKVPILQYFAHTDNDHNRLREAAFGIRLDGSHFEPSPFITDTKPGKDGINIHLDLQKIDQADHYEFTERLPAPDPAAKCLVAHSLLPRFWDTFVNYCAIDSDYFETDLANIPDRSP